MTADVDIANRALQAMGTRSTISSLGDGSAEADAVNLIYAATRDELFRAAHWNFTRKTATLTLLKSAPGTPENAGTQSATQWNPSFPAPPWLFEYGYPSDCLKLRFIVPQISTSLGIAGAPLTSAAQSGIVPYWNGPPVRFIAASDQDSNGNTINVILTNQDQAIAVYTARIADPDLWDPQFQAALVAALAAKLTVPLSGDKTLQKLNLDLLQGTLAAARVSDGNEGITVDTSLPDWMRVRGAGRDWGLGGLYAGWSAFPCCGWLI